MIIINKNKKDKVISNSEIEHAVLLVLKKLKKENFDVSINFVTSSKIKSLNKKYRNKDSVTDVLSFSTLEGLKIDKTSRELGDIFICLSQIRKQARENKIEFKEELWRMLVHGVLHLVGYDHVKKEKAVKMFKLQEDILKILIVKS